MCEGRDVSTEVGGGGCPSNFLKNEREYFLVRIRARVTYTGACWWEMLKGRVNWSLTLYVLKLDFYHLPAR